VKTTTKIVFASALALSAAAPAFAQTSGYDQRKGADRKATQLHSADARRARNSFAMESGSEIRIDADSPATAGGASLGYNRMLLDF